MSFYVRIDIYEQLRLLSMQNFSERHLFRNRYDSDKFRRNLAEILHEEMEKLDSDIIVENFDPVEIFGYILNHVGKMSADRIEQKISNGYFLATDGHKGLIFI